MLVKCKFLLEPCPSSSRVHGLLKVVVEDLMRRVLDTSHLHPSGAWDSSRTRGLHGGCMGRTGIDISRWIK